MTNTLSAKSIFPISETLKRASELCRLIQKRSNLHAVIPVWSDGDRINVGSFEEIHSRSEWVHRAYLDRIAGVWTVSEASEEVSDFLNEAISEFST